MAEVVTSFTPEQGGSLSIPEPGTPQFSSFVGTDGPELRVVRFLSERTAPTLASPIRPVKRRRTISDGQYAAARVGVTFVGGAIADVGRRLDLNKGLPLPVAELWLYALVGTDVIASLGALFGRRLYLREKKRKRDSPACQ